MKWFKKTPKSYTDEQLAADHEETIRQVFGSDYSTADVEEQLAEAEAPVDDEDNN